jgi:hypothetical protein
MASVKILHPRDTGAEIPGHHADHGYFGIVWGNSTGLLATDDLEIAFSPALQSGYTATLIGKSEVPWPKLWAFKIMGSDEPDTTARNITVKVKNKPIDDTKEGIKFVLARAK